MSKLYSLSQIKSHHKLGRENKKTASSCSSICISQGSSVQQISVLCTTLHWGQNLHISCQHCSARAERLWMWQYWSDIWLMWRVTMEHLLLLQYYPSSEHPVICQSVTCRRTVAVIVWSASLIWELSTLHLITSGSPCLPLRANLCKIAQQSVFLLHWRG